MMSTLETLRVIVLVAVIFVCIVRIVAMTSRTKELEAWGYICLAVGSAWRIAAIAHYNAWLLNVDETVNEDLAALLVGIGILLIVTHNSWPWLLSFFGTPKNVSCHRRQADDDYTTIRSGD